MEGNIHVHVHLNMSVGVVTSHTLPLMVPLLVIEYHTWGVTDDVGNLQFSPFAFCFLLPSISLSLLSFYICLLSL